VSVSASTGDALRQVGQSVIDRVGIPKDKWEITAQLEVLGFRDSDAAARFGCRDLFDAADRIFALFRDGTLTFVVDEERAQPRFNALRRFLHHYFEGLMFALPMVLQGCAMLVSGYGLWGAVDLDVRTGSAIGLGFITSYIVTGGFSWAIVRRGLFYYYQNEGGLARWSTLRLWWISVRVTLLLALPAFLLNFVYGFLPNDMFLIAVAYYVALSFLWLNWSLIYLVRATLALLVVLAFSICVVIVTARVLGWPILAANLTGLVVADLLTFAIAFIGLKRWARNGAGKPTVNPPRLAVLVYSTANVFRYGFLYSAFIFSDRILAWTSARGREAMPPYPFWLSARYEVGMDLALIVIVVLAGLVEHFTNSFSYELVPRQKHASGGSPEHFVAQFRSLYRRHSMLLAVFAALAILVAGASVGFLRTLPYPRLQDALVSATTMRVFWVAALSYAIFMFALRDILLLMTLSRADLAVRAMAVALAVNVAVGFTMSRAFHYSASVAGLFAGCVVLAVLSHRSVRRILVELDYHYYAAY
jgi:hypothetical protein